MVGWLDGWMVGWLDGWMVGWLATDGGWLHCVAVLMSNARRASHYRIDGVDTEGTTKKLYYVVIA